MIYRRPVIATRYSGNLQFMSSRNSFLVDYRETAVTVADGPFQRGSIWAEPDIEHAAYLMRQVYLDRAHAAKIAARGRADVLAQLSPAVIANIVGGALGVDLASLGGHSAGRSGSPSYRGRIT
jgi:hypothetical protein